MIASAGGVERSPLAMALLVILVLVVVIVATGIALYREERLFHEERAARQRLRNEINNKINRDETRQ